MTVLLLYGGRSAEHEVSIDSAFTVYKALMQASYKVVLIGISYEGKWYLQQTIERPIRCANALHLVPGDGIYSQEGKLQFDVAFATTHGTGGEDGDLQGLCRLCNIALCGSDTVSSALGMHKALSGELFARQAIPTVKSIVIDADQDIENIAYFEDVCHFLGKKLFIKPECGGSSIGVCALPNANPSEFIHAVMTARLYSERVLVQQLIENMYEAECGILRTKDGQLLVAGPARVIDTGKAEDGWLSYRHKYGPINTAHLKIPSDIRNDIALKIRGYALQAFQAIACDGYARIDFFVQDETIYLNEINTFPGMTEKSHYPQLLYSEGYSLEAVLESLLHDALRRFSLAQNRVYHAPSC
jgi:D-alanine-D-alanine ligase